MGCPSSGVECLVERVAPAHDCRPLAGSASRMATSYTAKDITVLEGLEPVRKRPGMYIGGVGIDRAPPPRLGDPRQRRRRGDERLRLEYPRHAARGRLVNHHRRRRPRHSRGQAPDDEEERARGDLHGAPRGRQVRGTAATRPPAACTASAPAWSTRCRRSSSPRSSATARCWEMRFKQGKPVGPLKKLGPARGTGTTVYFHPDADHLPEDRVRRRRHPGAARGRQLPPQGLKVVFEDETNGRRRTVFEHTGGPRRLPAENRRGRGAKPVHEVPFTLTRGERAAPGTRAAVDRGHRRAHALATSTASPPVRAARTRTGCAPASARRCATSSRPTTCRPRA